MKIIRSNNEINYLYIIYYNWKDVKKSKVALNKADRVKLNGTMKKKARTKKTTTKVTCRTKCQDY